MTKRAVELVEGKIYHIFSKSIAGFKIFRTISEYERMRNAIRYYKTEDPPIRSAMFLEIKNKEKFHRRHHLAERKLVEIVAYCFMPSHIHLVLKQIKRDGISIFMGNALNSYSRYFNVKTKRKGPLWESRFKNVIVKTDEQLLHLTRYIHLNPVAAHLVRYPEEWRFSSYSEYVAKLSEEQKLCNYSDILDIRPDRYRKFVHSQIDYQRKLARFKHLFLD